MRPSLTTTLTCFLAVFWFAASGVQGAALHTDLRRQATAPSAATCNTQLVKGSTYSPSRDACVCGTDAGIYSNPAGPQPQRCVSCASMNLGNGAGTNAGVTCGVCPPLERNIGTADNVVCACTTDRGRNAAGKCVQCKNSIPGSTIAEAGTFNARCACDSDKFVSGSNPGQCVQCSSVGLGNGDGSVCSVCPPQQYAFTTDPLRCVCDTDKGSYEDVCVQCITLGQKNGTPGTNKCGGCNATGAVPNATTGKCRCPGTDKGIVNGKCTPCGTLGFSNGSDGISCSPCLVGAAKNSSGVCHCNSDKAYVNGKCVQCSGFNRLNGVQTGAGPYGTNGTPDSCGACKNGFVAVSGTPACCLPGQTYDGTRCQSTVFSRD